MLDTFGSFFLLLGPMVIILIGVVITLVLTSLWRGLKRWLVLFCAPALTLVIAFAATYLVTTFINPSEGSGFLLGGAAIALYFGVLILYYPILFIAALVQYFKTRKSLPPQSRQKIATTHNTAYLTNIHFVRFVPIVFSPVVI